MNEINPRAQIEVDPFDREYELNELVPLKTLEALFQGAESSPAPMVLYRTDGTAYFERGIWKPAETAAIGEFIRHSAPQSAMVIPVPGSGDFAVYPLTYEMEVKGYLALPGVPGKPGELPAFGSIGANVLLKMMRLKHQTMMTSGLHGVVVEESFAQLREKAAQLSRSEEKYRRLAANLEIEVQKKAAEIKTAQVYLMQQEKLAAIGQLAAGMAHEINTPLGFMISNLNTLKGYVQDINDLLTAYRELAEFGMTAKTDAGCNDFKNQCKMISGLERKLDCDFLLDDILLLADETMQGAGRIQKIVGDLKRVARPGENEPELINVAESIDAVLSILANRLNDGLTIVRDYEDVPLVPGVAQELNHVWLNLLLNAAEATEQGGTLTIGTHAADDYVEVTVSDTGCGISEENLTRIFDPFYTTKPVASGTGMGLHLAFQVLDQHGGRISATSKPGRGSAFTVWLPVRGRGK